MNAPGDSTSPKSVAIIPARIGSEEVHAKVLTELGGKTVIEHVFDRVVESNVFDDILVAADHKRIIDVAQGFGARTYLTTGDHICGTDRCAEAAREVFPNADIVVNIQADEPFLNPRMIPLVVEPLTSDDSWDITTLCCPSPEGANRESPFTVKIVRTPSGRAIYFSRSMIPFPRYEENTSYVQHIGIYGYRMQQLQQFATSGPSALELAEGLEQLRALELEMRIKVIETNLDYPRVSIDTQDDIDRAQKLVSKMQHTEGAKPCT
jgi:3-deoxy-manno-octulosonate cytidylyltransferase (CMP-KDO synthetase)